MKKIIKIVFSLVLLYFFISPSFVSSIDFGKQLENCDAVKKWESENLPSVTYCPYPIIEMGTDPDTNLEKITALRYVVFVNRPKDNINVELKFEGFDKVYDFDIEQLIGKPQGSLHIDYSSDSLIANFNGSFMLTRSNPPDNQAEWSGDGGKPPLIIKASSDKVLVNVIAAEPPVPGVKNDCEDFLKSVFLTHGLSSVSSKNEMNPAPEVWGVALAMSGVVGSMIPNADKMYFPKAGNNNFKALFLEDFTSQLNSFRLSNDWDGYENAVRNIVNDPNNWHYFDSRDAVLNGITDYYYQHYNIEGRLIEHPVYMFSWDNSGSANAFISIPYGVSGTYTGTLTPADANAINAVRELGIPCVGMWHPHPYGLSMLSQIDERGAENNNLFDVDTIYMIVWGDADQQNGFYTVQRSIARIYYQDRTPQPNQAASSPGTRRATPTTGAPIDLSYQYVVQYGAYLNNFDFYAELSEIYNYIGNELELSFINPNDPNSLARINEFEQHLTDLSGRIPATLVGDDRTNAQTMITDGFTMIGRLRNFDNGDYNGPEWLQTYSGWEEHYGSINERGVNAMALSDHYFELFSQYKPPQFSQEWLLINLVKLDEKLDKINAILDMPFTKTIGRILHKNDPENFPEESYDSYDYAVSALRSFGMGAALSMFASLGGMIKSYGERAQNRFWIIIGWGIQIYSWVRTTFYYISAGVKLLIVWITEGPLAGILFTTTFIISFTIGYLVGMFLMMIIESLIRQVYCFLWPLNCEPCTMDPAYKDNENDETPDLFLPPKTYVGGKLKYMLCGVKYCDPEKFTVRLYQDSGGGYNLLFGHSECSSKDGGCFNCTLVRRMSDGNFNVKAALAYENNNIKYWSESKPLRVSTCPSPYSIDPEYPEKCISCTGHIETSSTEDTPDHKCEAVCGASPECDEVSPGTSWCDGNLKKTCDSNCQYSYEECGNIVEDSDGGNNIIVMGTCHQQGCSNGQCIDESYTDHCLCEAKVPATVIKQEKCTAKSEEDCKNDPDCYLDKSLLLEYYVPGLSCEPILQNCENYGSQSSCSSGHCACVGDINHDGTVNIIDISIVATAFGSKPGDKKWNAKTDLNGDGVINIVDLAIVARQFGESC